MNFKIFLLIVVVSSISFVLFVFGYPQQTLVLDSYSYDNVEGLCNTGGASRHFGYSILDENTIKICDCINGDCEKIVTSCFYVSDIKESNLPDYFESVEWVLYYNFNASKFLDDNKQLGASQISCDISKIEIQEMYSDKVYSLNVNGKQLDIVTKSNDTIEDIFYDELTQSLVLNVNAKSYVNFVQIEVPKELMNGRFSVTSNGAAMAQLVSDERGDGSTFYVSKSDDFNTLKIYFVPDQKEIRISSY